MQSAFHTVVAHGNSNEERLFFEVTQSFNVMHDRMAIFMKEHFDTIVQSQKDNMAQMRLVNFFAPMTDHLAIRMCRLVDVINCYVAYWKTFASKPFAVSECSVVDFKQLTLDLNNTMQRHLSAIFAPPPFLTDQCVAFDNCIKSMEFFMQRCALFTKECVEQLIVAVDPSSPTMTDKTLRLFLYNRHQSCLHTANVVFVEDDKIGDVHCLQKINESQCRMMRMTWQSDDSDYDDDELMEKMIVSENDDHETSSSSSSE
jgi:hypothetical protein